MVAVEGLERIITELAFFQGLDPRYVTILAGCASNVRFTEGQLLIQEGEKIDRFYVIRRGRVAIETFAPQRGPVTIQTVGEGDVLSWSWLFPPYESQFDARALTLVRVLAFDGACLREKCERDHSLGFEFMKRLSRVVVDRLRATRIQLLDVYGNDKRS